VYLQVGGKGVGTSQVLSKCKSTCMCKHVILLIMIKGKVVKLKNLTLQGPTPILPCSPIIKSLASDKEALTLISR
jgi:hypothetical protein